RLALHAPGCCAGAAPPAIVPFSLHDALPISCPGGAAGVLGAGAGGARSRAERWGCGSVVGGVVAGGGAGGFGGVAGGHRGGPGQLRGAARSARGSTRALGGIGLTLLSAGSAPSGTTLVWVGGALVLAALLALALWWFRRRAAGAPPRGDIGRALDEIWGPVEEHTSELQSRENLVCRLLLEKKKRAGNAEQASPGRNST